MVQSFPAPATKRFYLAIFGALAVGVAAHSAQIEPARLDTAAAAIADHVIAWRRDIHQNPELSNREFRTSALVTEHLTKLGLEVKTKIAHTGVAAVLRGGRPGPVIALRADMDALPVKEVVEVPFKSVATADYAGRRVSVMHACGHDAHTAILMGAAEILTGMRADLPGTILFIFQPAEEGAPEGERGGAELMLEEGLFEMVKPEAVFGLHVRSPGDTGTLAYRAGPLYAAVDTFTLKVRGVQTHGARPWAGVDPIVVSSQIVLGLQTIISRQTDISTLPAVLTIGSIHGGIRHNIIPDDVEMQGTLRTFDRAMRDDIVMRLRRTAENIAEASGATAELTLHAPTYPVTVNDPALTARVLPSLQRVVGAAHVEEAALWTAAEDFAFYAQRVPGFFFAVGVTPPGQDATKVPANHSPRFTIDEAALGVGLRAMLHVAVDYLQAKSSEAPAP